MDQNQKFTDEQLFMQMGIFEYHRFRIKELDGLYMLDLNDKVIRDVTKGYSGVVVKGLYEHLLDGTWHKQI